jgi:hypothetical protein
VKEAVILRFETGALAKAMIILIGLHLVLLFFLIFPSENTPKLIFLGGMNFIYDPLGGQPGGGEAGPMAAGEVQSSPLATETPEPVEALIPEPEQIIKESEDLSIIESLAPTAEVIPLAAPKPSEKKSKPKPPRPVKPIGDQAEQGTNLTGPGSGGGVGSGTGGGEGAGQGGFGGGSGRGSADALAAYKSQVRRKIVRYRKYPRSAKNNRKDR